MKSQINVKEGFEKIFFSSYYHIKLQNRKTSFAPVPPTKKKKDKEMKYR